MTKRKIIFYSIILIILFSFLTVGTIGTIMGNTYKNNEVSFVVDDVKAYCNILGKFYYKNSETQYAEVTDTLYRPYNQTYYPGAEYSQQGFDGFAQWESLPDANFNIDKKQEVYKYEIVITNLNPNLDLSVQLKNVIIGQETTSEDLLFYTTISYKLDDGENVVKFSNKGEGVNLGLYKNNTRRVSLIKDVQSGVDNSAIIPVKSKLTISVEIERKTITKTINGDIYTNNFTISLDAVEQINEE